MSAVTRLFRTKCFKPLYLFCAIVSALAVTPAYAQSEQAALIDKAKATIETFATAPDMEWLRKHLHEAKGVVIVPSMVKAGFIFGGSGGTGVLLPRDAKSGVWGYPAFYTMGSVTFGLQIGAEVAEVVLMVMTQDGLEALLTTSAKLGADTSIAAGPLGGGAKVQTADIIAFSRAKGLYGGLNVEGAIVKPRNEWNKAYYGADVRPLDILVQHKVKNPQADPLREALARLAKTTK